MSYNLFPRPKFLPVVLVCTVLVIATQVLGAKEKESSGTVDSGAFGIYVSGQRIGTETFNIEQTGSGSVTRSDIKVTDGGQQVEQRAEMQLAPNGDLVKYEWREVSPGRGSRVVQVDSRSPDKFLIEHIDFGDKAKPVEQPFLSPASTVILDDYFFSHRELLAWRYIGGICKSGGKECNPQKIPFGALSPHDAASFLVNVEYKGREKVTIRGTEMELIRLDLSSVADEWSLWMNNDYKVMRMTVAGTNTEIVRD